MAIKAFNVPTNKSNRRCVKTFMEKATKPSLGRGKERKNLLYSWIGGFHILKIIVFPKFTYKFNMISIKFPIGVFKELEENRLKNLQKKRREQGLQEKERRRG